MSSEAVAAIEEHKTRWRERYGERVPRSLHLMTRRQLQDRLAMAYRDGYEDGRDGTPYNSGYWVNPLAPPSLTAKDLS